eukprot:CAMPEP_0170582402 /NCGR_PEP_ID=MMETSP0224-20130122/7564_1 /TAXON_ID=285029 /ORGANISM="Togula jolla, Strain CCCM 725" /LENGTH=214 /DNA_ID=CAMNT_0010905623 /DNA_START=807 /DNA_END=1451 /DNA_ORIENTATION=+
MGSEALATEGPTAASASTRRDKEALPALEADVTTNFFRGLPAVSGRAQSKELREDFDAHWAVLDCRTALDRALSCGPLQLGRLLPAWPCWHLLQASLAIASKMKDRCLKPRGPSFCALHAPLLVQKARKCYFILYKGNARIETLSHRTILDASPSCQQRSPQSLSHVERCSARIVFHEGICAMLEQECYQLSLQRQRGNMEQRAAPLVFWPVDV